MNAHPCQFQQPGPGDGIVNLPFNIEAEQALLGALC